MDVEELLNRPVSKEISDAVWEAFEMQKARRVASEPVVVRGRVAWSVAAGFQFFPEDASLGDKLVEKLQGRDWHVGIQGEIRL